MTIITGHLLVDLAAVLLVCLVLIILYFKWSFQYWKKRGLNLIVEPTVPWGSLLAPHRRVISIGEEVAQIYKEAKAKGWKNFGLYNLSTPVFITTDLDTLKHILTKDFNHFVDRGIYVNERDEPITAHLFAIGGKKWRNLRTKFTPTFTSGKMRQMFQTVIDCGKLLEDYLTKEVKYHESIDIKNILGNFGTDVIGSVAFGLNCNSFVEPDSPFRRMGNKIFNRNSLQNLKFTIGMNLPYLAHLLRLTVFDKEISDFFTKVVEDTVNYREKNKVTRHDFLQLLIDMRNNKEGSQQEGDGKSLTIDEMVAQSFVFFVAGFETSSTTMTFVLYELSKNPDVQEKVRKEINEVLKKHNDLITYDSLNDMKYLSQVIDEALRMYPPVPLITRECVEDYVVPDTDIKIGKGAKVFVPIKGIHYDEDYYEHPEVFDPDRFTEENKQGRHPYAHIPFGEGPRMCIGMRFGIMQSKVGLAFILKNFRVALSKKTKEPLTFTPFSLVPQVNGGIWLDLEKISVFIGGSLLSCLLTSTILL